MLHVAFPCHLAHVANANSHNVEQDVAADLDIDQSVMSCEDPKINLGRPINMQDNKCC